MKQFFQFEVKRFKLTPRCFSGGNGLKNNQRFTTKDRDQDTSNESNCAVLYHGAGWFTSCHSANLNGKYLSGTTTEFATGMVWKPWRGHYYSLKTSQMMFRPHFQLLFNWPLVQLSNHNKVCRSVVVNFNRLRVMSE